MRHRGLVLFLSALCLGLGALVWREYAEPTLSGAVLPGTTDSRASPTPPLPKEAPFALAPLEAYAEVIQRPLFSSTRKPPPEAARQAAGDTSSFVLLGIVISESGRSILLQHGRPPVLVRLSEGQAVEGWTLQTIRPESVVFVNGGTEQEFKLKDLRGAGAAPGAAPPPPPRRAVRDERN